MAMRQWRTFIISPNFICQRKPNTIWLNLCVSIVKNKPAIDGGTMDIKMQNENGVSEKYNTLREIPDATLRAYLNQETTFSGLFDGGEN